MKVKDVMMRTAASCTPETNVGAAVEILWNRNCGILPVVDSRQKVIAVVTDRDLCIALGTRNCLPGEITVGQVASGKLFTCKSEDQVRSALATMGETKVRRLPVVNAEGRLEGILSMDDIVVHSESKVSGTASELSHDDVVGTLKKLYRRDLPQMVQHKAAGA